LRLLIGMGDMLRNKIEAHEMVVTRAAVMSVVLAIAVIFFWFAGRLWVMIDFANSSGCRLSMQSFSHWCEQHCRHHQSGDGKPDS